MSKVILEVPDISCAHCEKTVLGALQDRPGVKSVQVNIPAKSVYLDYDESAFSLDQVKEVLDEEGYPVASATEGDAPDDRRQVFTPVREIFDEHGRPVPYTDESGAQDGPGQDFIRLSSK